MIDNNIDKRNILDEEPFSYKTNKDKKIFISYRGKEVMILRGKKSEGFLSKMQNANNKDAQLIMAKITGNFKHGNETNNKLRY